jgi:hypothetical protein
MAVASVTKPRGSVEGKAKRKTVLAVLSGTYANPAGEVVTAKECGARRIVSVGNPTVIKSVASATVPVLNPFCKVESSGTKISLHFINPITGAELVNASSVAAAEVEIPIVYY